MGDRQPVVDDRYFIGIDSGSQSTKVSMINRRGRVVCSAVQPLQPTMSRQTGWVEHPEDDLWDSLKAALNELMRVFDGDTRDILAVGLCSIRCCRVFLSTDGTLAEPVMSWMDVRAYDTFKDHPEIGYTGSTSGYLTFRLTGELKDTIANSLQYQFPVDMHTWQWSEDPDHFNRFQIPRHKLLEMHLPGDILGHVTRKASEETGLPAGLPVVATANDKAVEALGSGLINTDAALLSLGTYITSMVYGDEYREATDNLFTNLSCIPHRYLYESAGIRGGMWHISWFKEIIGEEFARTARAAGRSVENLLEEEAVRVPAGSDSLLIIPDWLAPSDQRHRKGVMIGFDQRHTRGHIYRALMEGIAMGMKNNFDAMTEEIGSVPEELIVCGGGSNSDLFMQIVADVFGMKTVRNTVNGAAGLGAAISAAVAVGFYQTHREAVGEMVQHRDEFEHDEARHRMYTRFNSRAYRNMPALLENPLTAIHRAGMPEA